MSSTDQLLNKRSKIFKQVGHAEAGIATLLTYLDLISFIRCAKLSRYLNRSAKTFDWNNYNFSSGDPAIQYCLRNASLASMLEVYPLINYQSAKEWSWPLLPPSSIILCIYDQLLHFTALSELHLPCIYNDYNIVKYQIWAPVFEQNLCAFSHTLKHLKIY